jgi:hypothetical protein
MTMLYWKDDQLDLPLGRITVSESIPPGCMMLMPARRPNETDEELAARCVVVKGIDYK